LERQTAQYAFPYHWLPRAEDGVWYVWRHLNWGFEYLARVTAVTELVQRTGARRVLDLGCGDGRLAYELLAAGIDEVVGVDLADQAIAFAQAFNHPFLDRARFYCGPLQTLDEGAFDAATAMEVLEHVPDVELPAVVEALWARLRDDTPLVLTVPTTNVALTKKHERHYTLERLRSHLAPYFRVEEVRYLHRIGRNARLVQRALINRLFILRHPRLVRYATHVYERRVRDADAVTGANLLALCRREPGARVAKGER
jgi:2-polyprenyl-3-methyl-5-hydroxy-6-metoxy-1,4-benzoquinol methylase